jgi:hypothetical protein
MLARLLLIVCAASATITRFPITRFPNQNNVFGVPVAGEE